MSGRLVTKKMGTAELNLMRLDVTSRDTISEQTPFLEKTLLHVRIVSFKSCARLGPKVQARNFLFHHTTVDCEYLQTP
jgi:hypothetical protein